MVISGKLPSLPPGYLVSHTHARVTVNYDPRLLVGKLPSPAELLMGRKLQPRVLSYTPRIPNHKHIRQSFSDRQYTHAHYHDRHAHEIPPLSTGDLITTQHPTTGCWNRASIVDVCAHPRSYIIETEDGAQYRRNRRHIRHRELDPIPATEYENHTLPRAPKALVQNRVESQNPL